MKLSAKELFFRYDHRDVLQGITLDLSAGQLVGLLGPNAAGKTTLMNNLAGLQHPYRGEVLLEGEILHTLPARARSRKVAIVPQEEDIFLPFTVSQVVAMGRAPYLGFLGFETKEDHQKIEEALKITETNDLQNRPFHELSGGERRRAIIARALAQETSILLMDEPTTHLDIHHQIALLELTLRLTRDRQLTTLISLHDINLASLYCDRILLIKDGQIFADGSPKEVITEETLWNVFQAQTSVQSSDRSDRPFYQPKRPTS